MSNLNLSLTLVDVKLVSPGPASSRLTQHARTTGADDNSLGAAEDSGDPAVCKYLVEATPSNHSLPVAAGALDIHEVTVRMLDKSLQLVPPLFFSGKRVQ